MSWDEFMAARRLLSEEMVGTYQRAVQAADQEQVETTQDLIRKYESGRPQASTPAVIPPRPITDEIIG